MLGCRESDSRLGSISSPAPRSRSRRPAAAAGSPYRSASPRRQCRRCRTRRPASSPAAVVSGIPWSCAGDEVGRDQPGGRRPTDGEPDRQRQNVRVRAAMARVSTAPAAPAQAQPPTINNVAPGCPPEGRPARQQGATPRSGGSLRAQQTSGITARAAADTTRRRTASRSVRSSRPGSGGRSAGRGGAGRGQDAHDQAAAAHEPAVGHHGREHQSHRPGAEADQHPQNTTSCQLAVTPTARRCRPRSAPGRRR